MKIHGTGTGSGRPDAARAAVLAGAVRLLGAAVIACALALPVVSIAASRATSAVEPERLAAPMVNTDTQLTCGGGDRSFSWAALTAPTGAENGFGPEFEVLRDYLSRIDQRGAVGWRLASRADRWVRFLADTPAGGWVYIDALREDDGWRVYGGPEACHFLVVVEPGYWPATWSLDPAYPSPDADATELHVLIWERMCAGGSLTTGRNSAPWVRSDEDAVTIAIGVRPLEGGGSCPGVEGTPAIVTLPEPLGGRALLDGGLVPPGAPAAPRTWSVVRMPHPESAEPSPGASEG